VPPSCPTWPPTDLVIRLGAPPNDRLAFWSCKPAQVLADPKEGPRARERIELERLYASAVGARHAVYDGSHAPGLLLGNLDWLEPARSELRDETMATGRAAFARAFNGTSADSTVEQRIQDVANSLAMDLPTAQRHFRAVAWQGTIDADLSRPIVMCRPLPTGGHQLRHTLSQQLMGGTQ